jgi:ankyrin repeat protein
MPLKTAAISPESWIGALAHAAFGGHVSSVSVLLDAKVDPNIAATKPRGHSKKTLNHDSALCAAASGGHDEVVSLLLSHGALVDGCPGGKHPPLYLAAEGGHEGVVKMLLEAGADPMFSPRNTSSLGSKSPLHVAVSQSHVGVVNMLLGCAQVAATRDSPSDIGQPAMHIAAALGHTEVAKTLLAGGASPVVVDVNKRSAVCEASLRSEGAGVLELLLEAGADANLGAPLCIAAECGVVETVTVLLRHKADPNCKDGQNATPLFHAAREGFPGVASALLAAGADQSLLCWKKTPLQAAEEAGNNEVAMILREYL